MLFFPFLAALIWYFASKYRRTWRGVVAIFVGMGVFAFLEIMLIRVGNLGLGGLNPWLVVWLLIFSGILVITVAIFIFFMPYPAPEHVHCRKCKYNLTGLDSNDLRCPECGVEWKRPTRCPHCRHDIRTLAAAAILCPECGSLLVPQALAVELAAHEPPPGAEQQHKHRQARDEHPPDQAHLPLAERGNKRH